MQGTTEGRDGLRLHEDQDEVHDENLGDGDRSVTVEKKFNEEGRPYLDLRGQITRPSFAPLSRVDATVLARVLEAMAQGLPE